MIDTELPKAGKRSGRYLASVFCTSRFPKLSICLIGACVLLLSGCGSSSNPPETGPVILAPTTGGSTTGGATTDGTTTAGTATGDFSVSLPVDMDTLNIVEGSNGLSVNVSITRTGGHQREVGLALFGETVADAENLTASFSDSSVSSSESGSTLNLNLTIAPAAILQQQRRLILRATDGQGSVDKLILMNVEPVNAPDIYLLVGQSNMQGSSELDAKDAGPNGLDEPNPRILQLNVTGNNFDFFATETDFTDREKNVGTPRFIVAEDPLHELYDPGNTTKFGQQIGMGLSFAKAALPFTSRDIVLVPAAWSGTAFCNNDLGNLAWNPAPTTNPALGGTSLFDRAIVRADLAIAETGGILRGILWHQGESDSTNLTCSGLYRENLELLVRSLRSTISPDARGASARGPASDVPFVLGTMSKGDDPRGAFSVFDPAKTEVDAVHRSITMGPSPEIDHAGVVDNDVFIPASYPCGEQSCVHFGATAYREMGRSYYQKIREINAR